MLLYVNVGSGIRLGWGYFVSYVVRVRGVDWTAESVLF